MTSLRDLPLHRLQFYLTAAYPCSYLTGRIARSQVATPASLVDTTVFSELARMGFRRSGLHIYRPRCDTCRACVPVRIPVAAFSPSRSQRRCLTRNAGLHYTIRPPVFEEAHYRLYQRYQATRHSGGGMDLDDREQYRSFLLTSRVDSALMEYRLGDRIVMVALVDRLLDGLSAVYTFFDPDLERQSLGVYSVLCQIELARRMALPYLYLGYWIRESPKMAYKRQYRLLEALVEGQWQALEEDDGPLA